MSGAAIGLNDYEVVIRSHQIEGLTVLLVEGERDVEILGDHCEPDYHYLDYTLTRRPYPSRGTFTDLNSAFENLGEIFLVPAGSRMTGWGSAGRQRSLRLFFPVSYYNEIAKGNQSLCGNLQIEDASLRRNLRLIAGEMIAPGFASDLMIQGWGYVIFAEMCRLKNDLLTDGKRTGGLAPWRMRLIEERLVGNMPPPRLDELAEICGLSRRHLMRAFREETGQNLGAYVAAAALSRARDRLCQTRWSVSEIAAEAGFCSGSSFATAFRRASGFTPAEYRAANRAQLNTGSVMPPLPAQ